MTDAAAAPKRMNVWLAGLLGIVVVLLLTGFLGAAAHPGVVATVLLIATAAGAFLAARLSGRRGPAWATAAFGLLFGVLYLTAHHAGPGFLPPEYANSLPDLDIPLWLTASVLGAPLLGGRIGEAGVRR